MNEPDVVFPALCNWYKMLNVSPACEPPAPGGIAARSARYIRGRDLITTFADGGTENLGQECSDHCKDIKTASGVTPRIPV